MALALLLASVVGAACGVTTSARERARKAWEDENFAGAATAFEEYLTDAPPGPDREDALLRLADIYYHNLKQFERARDLYAQFLGEYPASTFAFDARERLAEVNIELKNPLEAIAQYERLLEDFPNAGDHRKIRATIADLYFKQDQFSQSEVEYQRVVESDAYDEITEQALLRLATIAHLVHKEDVQAIALYERVVVGTQDLAVRRSTLYAISQSYADLFRFDEAIATLDRIDDPNEAAYVAERKQELLKQKKEHADAPPEVDWSRGKGEDPPAPPAP